MRFTGDILTFIKTDLPAIIESAYKFLSEMAGNLPDYDECLRALFANDAATFEKLTRTWPQDIREHAIKMAFNQ
ncbi:DUF2239 family protein [Morganella morganii]|uniref:DUF2239 family protein n=1 Tax=Morganella morganii TaxID=582 RepID=UPI001CECFD12|nr:DUF2239 family protein [Morganella morganii]